MELFQYNVKVWAKMYCNNHIFSVYACNTTEYVEAYDSDIEIMSHLGYADDNDDIPYSK